MGAGRSGPHDVRAGIPTYIKIRYLMFNITNIFNLAQTSALLTSDLRLFDPIWEENRICVALKNVAPSVITALVAIGQ
jgi:hypothetical protein